MNIYDYIHSSSIHAPTSPISIELYSLFEDEPIPDDLEPVGMVNDGVIPNVAFEHNIFLI